ncbi:hypothetical protein [Rhodopseudomonas palustris]|uniref:Uncharacterized protein n=1 Tax=Rhodopseudomonas palustris (strain BisB18) TaxID=316056 RepID=Q20ZT6_RHOPB
MTETNTFVLLLAVGLGAVALPAPAPAQWWSRTPADFEDCAEHAEKTASSKQARADLVMQCEAKFAGRRKPGGGYTYYDFMQNKHFDIAGPNPTAEEQREFDQHYTAFLDEQRRSIIAAAFAQKQRELNEDKPVSAPPPSPQPHPTRAQAGPVAPPAPASARASSDAARPAATRPPRAARPPRAVASVCREDALSCGWSHLAAGVSSIKKTLFGPPPKKTKRG